MNTTSSATHVMKLYGHPGSICTNRVLFMFAEKGVTPELCPVDLAKGEHKSASHLARHPFGRVPVLEDGGFSLYESRAIIRYLDETLPGPKLRPESPRAVAEMEQWISIEDSYLSPPVSDIVKQKFLVRLQGGTIDIDALDRARKDVSHVLRVMDAALDGRAYVAGDELTLADVSLAPLFGMLSFAGEGALIEALPRVGAWWARVAARPSWRRVVDGTAAERRA